MNDTLTPAMMRRLADSIKDPRYGIDRSGLTEGSELNLILSPLVRVLPRYSGKEDHDIVEARDAHIANAKALLNDGKWELARKALTEAHHQDQYRQSIRLVASEEGIAAISMMKR